MRIRQLQELYIQVACTVFTKIVYNMRQKAEVCVSTIIIQRYTFHHTTCVLIN